MKFCAMSAGALGLTTTDLGKLEKALATEQTDGGTHVVWINGAACTGCTVSFANSMYYSSVQDLLVPWAKHGLTSTTNGTTANGPLDLDFIETLSSAVGQTALNAASANLGTSTTPFVLCVEGAIQTEGSNGNSYCTVGDNFAGNNVRKFKDEVLEYANRSNCLAVVAVGTCASFGGIPAAKGSVTGARGLISTGRITGGYQTVNTTGYWDYLKALPTGKVANVRLTDLGSGYTANPAVTFTLGGYTTLAAATATANTTTGKIASVVMTNQGAGYTSVPTVSFVGGFSSTGTTAKGVASLSNALSATEWATIMGKTVCVSGCPPHPDWLVGTIVYVLTYKEAPLMDKYHRPLDYYQEYQCTNCTWSVNNPSSMGTVHDIDGLAKASTAGLAVGNSPYLFRYKYEKNYEGCIGILGCKGRKTKADCSYRRWNTNTTGKGGTGWCVQTRAGCHGCTDPRYPDGWGKFFSFV